MWMVALLASCAAAVLVFAGTTAVRRRWLVVTVRGESMSPGLRPGDLVLVRRTAAGALRRGDVLVLWLPERPASESRARRQLVIKRVAALPTDPVPETVRPAIGASPGDVVPAGRIVVLGDAPRSADSRQWGYLPAELVVGVVRRRLAMAARPAAGRVGSRLPGA